jgi:eukaryotic-like serine/threonine-protein kinase
MNPETFTSAQRQRIRALFDEASELSASAQSAWLAAACPDDALVGDAVAQLLRWQNDADEFLENESAAAWLALPQPSVAAELQPGQVYGVYQLMRELGKGGMGVVFLARRTDKVHEEPVAIKFVWPGFGQEAVQRFLDERRILARFNHPNIARLLDGGSAAGGMHYLVMEYVEGQPLTSYCQTQRLNLTERLTLFRTICEAVQYAHRNLVVHRDLKPSNLLVIPAPDGQVGTPKLLDFGIAKLLARDGESAAASTLTRASQQPFTPRYASPEQMRNEPITTATDVYSLGVLLYELLTGVSPYRVATEAMPDLTRAVCEEEPARPSTRLAEQDTASAPPFLPAVLRGDLDRIVLKALQKDATQRYASVEQFSEDLRRYLSGEPVLARPATWRYHVGKYVQRNRAVVTMASLLALTLLGVALVTTEQLRASRSRERTQRRELYAADMRQAGQEWSERNLGRARELVERYQGDLSKIDGVELRGFEWGYLWNALHPLQQTWQHKDDANEIIVSPDGQYAFVAMQNGVIELWNLNTGQFERIFAQQATRIRALALSRDGRRLVSAGDKGMFHVWEVATGQSIMQNSQASAVKIYSAALTQDGAQLLTGGNDGLVNLWDVASRRLQYTLRYSDGWVHGVEFSPDGRWLAAAGTESSELKLWERQTGAALPSLVISSKSFFDLEFSSDGQWLAAATRSSGEVLIWNARSRQLLKTLMVAPPESIWSIAFSADGNQIATAGSGRVIRLWDWVTGSELSQVIAEFEVSTLAFVSDSNRQVLLATNGTTTQVFDFARLRASVSKMPLTSDMTSLALAPDGKTCAYGDASGQLALIDLVTGKQGIFSLTQDLPIEQVAFSPDGKLLAIAYGNSNKTSTVELRDPVTGALRLSSDVLGHYVNAFDFSPDGQTLAIANNDGTFNIRQVSNLQPSLTIRDHPSNVYRIKYAPTGQHLISLHENFYCKGWDARTGQQLFAAPCLGLGGFSPDGKLFASTDKRFNITLRDAATGAAVRVLKGHSNLLGALVFSPDGQRLASGGDDLSIRLWEVTTGHELLAFKGHTRRVTALAFAHDGQALFSGGKDKTLRIWRTATLAGMPTRP